MVDLKEIISGISQDKKDTMASEDILKLVEILNNQNKGINFETIFGFLMIKDMLNKSKDDENTRILKEEIETLRKELQELKNPNNQLFNQLFQVFMIKQLMGNNNDLSTKDILTLLLSQNQNQLNTVQTLYSQMLQETKQKNEEDRNKLIEQFKEMYNLFLDKVEELENRIEKSNKSTNELEDFMKRVEELKRMKQKIDEFVKEYKLEQEPFIKEGQLNIEKILDFFSKFISNLSGSNSNVPQMTSVTPPTIDNIQSIPVPQTIKEYATQIQRNINTSNIPKAPVYSKDEGEVIEQPPTNIESSNNTQPQPTENINNKQ